MYINTLYVRQALFIVTVNLKVSKPPHSQPVSNSDLQAKFGLIFNLGLINSRYARVDQTKVEN